MLPFVHTQSASLKQASRLNHQHHFFVVAADGSSAIVEELEAAAGTFKEKNSCFLALLMPEDDSPDTNKRRVKHCHLNFLQTLDSNPRVLCRFPSTRA